MKPTFDRVILQVEKEKEKEEKLGGIIIPDSVKKEKQNTVATVIATGPACKTAQVGSRVLYRRSHATEFVDGDQDYILVDEEDILVVF